MGGLDIFKANGQKKDWDAPENLKYPINSPKDDFSIYFTEAETMGYFSSNRYGGQGSDDIYSFVFTPPTELILSIATKELLEDGSIVSLDQVDIEILKEENEFDEVLFASLKTDEYGLNETTIKYNDKYTIRGSKEEYFTQSKKIEPIFNSKNDTIYLELIFEKIIIDKPIVIKNIYYDFDKWNIRKDAAIELDKIVTILLENPDIIIELGSHTDARGTFYYNDNLSQNRAESAVRYIIDNGISEDRITAKTYGENFPVNKCIDGVFCSEEDYQLNRRTEFKVTGYSTSQPVIYSANDE
jgi:outer membrane protein OmpA-like peptidoglycan-associated protein